MAAERFFIGEVLVAYTGLVQRTSAGSVLYEVLCIGDVFNPPPRWSERTPKSSPVLTGSDIRSRMCRHGHTIESLAVEHHLTRKRIREVRDVGVVGGCFVRNWMELTGPTKLPVERISRLLRTIGVPVASRPDAEARWNAGQTIYALHDQAGEPHQVHSFDDLNAYTTDQLMALA